MRFADTNVVIYSVSRLPDEAEKRRRAREVLARSDLVVSTQVLQEVYVVATRPTSPAAMSHAEAVTLVDSLTGFRVQPITYDVVQLALETRERFGLSYWDSAILAAARLSGCDIVYSEDMSHEQDYDGLRVINRFVD